MHVRLAGAFACALLLVAHTAAQTPLPTFSAQSAEADARTWARQVLQGRTLSCVHVTTRQSGYVHIDTATPAGRALTASLQAVRVQCYVRFLPRTAARRAQQRQNLF